MAESSPHVLYCHFTSPLCGGERSRTLLNKLLANATGGARDLPEGGRRQISETAGVRSSRPYGEVGSPLDSVPGQPELAFAHDALRCAAQFGARLRRRR